MCFSMFLIGLNIPTSPPLVIVLYYQIEALELLHAHFRVTKMAQEEVVKTYLILGSLLLLIAEILAQPEAQGVYLKREHTLAKPYHGKLSQIGLFAGLPVMSIEAALFTHSHVLRFTY